jgi:hypothetical protein
MADFLFSFKKGSRSIRRVLESDNPPIEQSHLTHMQTFFDLTNIQPVENITVKNAIGLWGKHFLPNRLREFLFKFFNNSLGLNVRTIHFGGRTRHCSFCTDPRIRPTWLPANALLADETFSHLFYECPITRDIHEQIENLCFSNCEERFCLIENRKKKWFGLVEATEMCEFLRLFFLTIQYNIWQYKLRKARPDAECILGETFYIMNSAIHLNINLFYEKNSLNIPIFRHWDRLQAPRW